MSSCSRDMRASATAPYLLGRRFPASAALRTLVILPLMFFPFVATFGQTVPRDTLKKVRDTGSITIGYRDFQMPMSYRTKEGRPVGYAIDLCLLIVDAVKTKLDLPKLNVEFLVTTPPLRIPLLANGTIDLECSFTNHSPELEQQAGFTLTIFVAGTRFVWRQGAGIKALDDLRGKTVVATAGTANMRTITDYNRRQKLGLTIIPASDVPDAFNMMDQGRAAAYAAVDFSVLAFLLTHRNAGDYVISDEVLNVRPQAIMLPKGDGALKKIADDTLRKTFTSGEIQSIYKKWFQSPIVDTNINFDLPMSDRLKRIFATPIGSPYPRDYE